MDGKLKDGTSWFYVPNGINFQYRVVNKEDITEIHSLFVENNTKEDAIIELTAGINKYTVEVEKGHSIIVADKVTISHDDQVYITTHTVLDLGRV